MMRWYFNDTSLQGQFAAVSGASCEPGAPTPFEEFLAKFLEIKQRIGPVYVMRTVGARLVTPGMTVSAVLQRSRKTDLRRAVLIWLDRSGPFVEDDTLEEGENLFEYCTLDVTYSGLGEAARRVKAGDQAQTFSVPGGRISFAVSPLEVDHGLLEDRVGVVRVPNVWTLRDLSDKGLPKFASSNWQQLVEELRRRHPRLLFPDQIYENKVLAREAYSDVIGNQALSLCGHLDQYMANRLPNGAEGRAAREIIGQFFTGPRALFTGESASNQNRFRNELTFQIPSKTSEKIFAHWHGKISHRVFRLHFEWPVPRRATLLRVMYLGPKITKD